MTVRVRLVLVPAGLILTASLAHSTTAPDVQDERRLDGLDTATVGASVPPGWERRVVRGAEAPESRVVSEPRWGHGLEVIARNSAAFYTRELDRPLDPDNGRLSWRWRVDRTPGDARLGVEGLDDSPARLFVLFGDGGLFSTPKAIFYSWGGGEPGDTAWIQEDDHDAAVIVVRGDRDPLGEWLLEDRDISADHARIFGPGTPDPVTAVGLLVDTDDTGGLAASVLGPITWRSGGTGPDRDPTRAPPVPPGQVPDSGGPAG